jgi:MFS family permease
VALVGALLAISALARFGGIAATRYEDAHIDLTIYVAGGRLVHAGINPYDWRDGVATREALRQAPGSYQAWVSESQERWDSYASSNLPLTLLWFSLADRFGSRPVHYRLLFALADCALSALIGVFVLRHWYGGRHHGRALLAALLLGALSPVLLNVGIRAPEDKGVQTLLMVGALYCARGRAREAALSAGLLGGSRAFKGLGFLIAPLAAARIAWAAPPSRRWRWLILYAGGAALATLVWFVPFLPEVITRASDRLATHVGYPTPEHASPFALIAALWPRGWQAVRFAFLAVLAGAALASAALRRRPHEIATAGALVGFVCVVLVTGSLDRLNMAFLPAILLIGCLSPAWGGRFAWGAAACYLPVAALGLSSERFDQLYALVLLLAITGFLAAAGFARVSLAPRNGGALTPPPRAA